MADKKMIKNKIMRTPLSALDLHSTKAQVEADKVITDWFNKNR